MLSFPLYQGMEIRKEMIGEGQITKQYKQAEASKFKDEIEGLKKDLEVSEGGLENSSGSHN